MPRKAVLISSARIAYRALAWGLFGLALVLVVLPGLEMMLDPTWHGTLPARPIVLGAVALMVPLSRAGRFPGKSAAAVVPLILMGLVGADYLLEATGCASPTGLHPVNAVGLAGFSLGLLRTRRAWDEEAEA
ncbi:MAG: hypothetical protein LOD85_05615 [Clostridia bacterium]